MSQVRTNEFRYSQELRATKNRELEGLAAVFNQETEIYDPSTGTQFRERVLPGAFRNCLDAGTDIRFLYNHDTARVIARRSAGNLRLSETDKGLHFVAKLPNTNDANDLWENVRAGNVTGNSFGFFVGPKGDSWTQGTDGQLPLRSLHEVHCFEISSTPFPAYEQTSVAARSKYFPEGIPQSLVEARSKMAASPVAVNDRDLALMRAKLELAKRQGL